MGYGDYGLRNYWAVVLWNYGTTELFCYCAIYEKSGLLILTKLEPPPPYYTTLDTLYKLLILSVNQDIKLRHYVPYTVAWGAFVKV